MEIKTLVLLSLSLAVALALPPFPPGVARSPVLTKEEQRPLMGDWVPQQGHVEVEHPGPQARLGPRQQQEKMAPRPLDMEQLQSQNVVELEVKVKPEIKVEQELKAEPEVKPEVKVQQELKAEPEVKPEVKVQQELKAEPEVKPEVKVQQELKAEPEVKPEVKVQQELKAEPEVKPEVKVQQELKAEPEVKPEVKVQPELKAEPEVKPEVKVQQELKAEPEVKPEVKVQQELKAEPDFKVQPEVEVEPDVQKETDPEEKPVFNEEQKVNEEFPVLMKLEAEAELGQDVQERHIDMERTYEIASETIMELEPQNDDMFEDKVSNTELSDVEKTAFQNQGPAVETLPEENLMNKEGNAFDEEAISNLEPRLNDEVIPEITLEEGPALDFMGQPILPLEEYYPNENVRMEMDLGKQQDSLTVDGMEPGSKGSPMADMPLFGEPALDQQDQTVFDGDAQITTRRRYCPGVVLEGKCYRFFKGPKRAVDAEFFCQKQFPGGHLASITSQRIHREVMNMMLRQNGKYTRSWIGGLRYLETGRFIWLDGSHWVYDDWLSGEPNDTAGVEDCLEVLALGRGKFNDFTCWERQAFICSYHYQ